MVRRRRNRSETQNNALCPRAAPTHIVVGRLRSHVGCPAPLVIRAVRKRRDGREDVVRGGLVMKGGLDAVRLHTDRNGSRCLVCYSQPANA